MYSVDEVSLVETHSEEMPWMQETHSTSHLWSEQVPPPPFCAVAAIGPAGLDLAQD